MSKVAIALRRNEGYQWKHRGGIHYRGNKVDEQRLFDLLPFEASGEESSGETKELGELIKFFLSDIRGSNFACVIEGTNEVYAITDVFSTVPLYLVDHEGETLVTDAPLALAECKGKKLDEQAAAELEMLGYTIGTKTVLEGVSWLLPASFLRIDKQSGSIREDRWYEPSHSQDMTARGDDFAKSCYSVYEEVFKDVVEALDGRPAFVPLTAGKDSKTVVTMLKRLGYKNITTFSLGVPDNREARAAAHVAKHLGVPNRFVEITPKLVNEMSCEGEFDRFWRDSFSLVARPTMMYMITALYRMRKEGVLPDDAVVLPGYNESIIIDGHYPLMARAPWGARASKMVDHCLCGMESYFSFGTDLKYVQAMRREIEQRYIDVGMAHGGKTAAAIVTSRYYWDSIESKLWFASGRAFECFGSQWISALGDHRLSRFWNRVPLDYAQGRRAWCDFSNTCIDSFIFPGESECPTPERPSTPMFNQLLRDTLPLSMISFLRSRLRPYSFEQDGLVNPFGIVDERDRCALEQYAKKRKTRFPGTSYEISKCLDLVR